MISAPKIAALIFTTFTIEVNVQLPIQVGPNSPGPPRSYGPTSTPSASKAQGLEK